MLNRKEILAACLYVAVIVAGTLTIAAFYKKNMTVLPILQHPESTLRQVAEPVTLIDDSIISLSEDIISTLRYLALVDFFLERSIPRGLSAPQVGISKRLVVCGINGAIKVMINPIILERKGLYMDDDDCMSVETDKGTVIKRSAYLKVKYKTLDNKEETLVAKNDNAALIEHEIDHLNGVLNVDYQQ